MTFWWALYFSQTDGVWLTGTKHPIANSESFKKHAKLWFQKRQDYILPDPVIFPVSTIQSL